MLLRNLPQTLARRMVRSFRYHFRSRAAVLCYHRIGKPESDPKLLSVSPEHFETQLRYLKKNFEIFRLTDLLTSITNGTYSGRAVAITFDDGYADNFNEALPLLRKHQIPATFFVSTLYTDSPDEIWTGEILRLYYSDQNISSLREKEFSETAQSLKGMNWKKKKEALNGLRMRFPISEASKMMTSAMLRQIAEDPLMSFGAHTYSHPRLAALSKEDQTFEIEKSKTDLEDKLGIPIHLFAYPFGGEGDYNQISIERVQAAGFSAALTTRAGLLKNHMKYFPFEIPRLLIRDWNSLEFSKFLSQEFSNRYAEY